MRAARTERRYTRYIQYDETFNAENLKKVRIRKSFLDCISSRCVLLHLRPLFSIFRPPLFLEVVTPEKRSMSSTLSPIRMKARIWCRSPLHERLLVGCASSLTLHATRRTDASHLASQSRVQAVSAIVGENSTSSVPAAL